MISDQQGDCVQLLDKAIVGECQVVIYLSIYMCIYLAYIWLHRSSWMMFLAFVFFCKSLFLTLSFLVTPTMILSIALSVTLSFFIAVVIIAN